MRFRWQPAAQHSPAHGFKNFLGPNATMTLARTRVARRRCSCYAQLLRPCGWATLGGSFSLVSTLARQQLGMCEASYCNSGAINFSESQDYIIDYLWSISSETLDASSDSSFKFIEFSQEMIHWIFALVVIILMLLHKESMRKVPWLGNLITAGWRGVVSQGQCIAIVYHHTLPTQTNHQYSTWLNVRIVTNYSQLHWILRNDKPAFVGCSQPFLSILLTCSYMW